MARDAIMHPLNPIGAHDVYHRAGFLTFLKNV